MALSNTATPIYYGQFRDAVMRGEIEICEEIEMEMNRIDARIANPGIWYDDKAIEGFIAFCEKELTLTDGENLHLLDSFKLSAEQIVQPSLKKLFTKTYYTIPYHGLQHLNLLCVHTFPQKQNHSNNARVFPRLQIFYRRYVISIPQPAHRFSEYTITVFYADALGKQTSLFCVLLDLTGV